MSDLTVTVHCCLCDGRTEHVVDMPEGWVHRYGGVDVEQDGFCPTHATVEAFAADQCLGCVSGWGECGLWQGFAFRAFTLTDDDMASIRRGICPKRVNGTLSVTTGPGAGVEEIDISERASTESGEALAQAILDYVQQYGVRRYDKF